MGAVYTFDGSLSQLRASAASRAEEGVAGTWWSLRWESTLLLPSRCRRSVTSLSGDRRTTVTLIEACFSRSGSPCRHSTRVYYSDLIHRPAANRSATDGPRCPLGDAANFCQAWDARAQKGRATDGDTLRGQFDPFGGSDGIAWEWWPSRFTVGGGPIGLTGYYTNNNLSQLRKCKFLHKVLMHRKYQLLYIQ